MALAKGESLSKLISNFSINSQKTAKVKQTKGFFIGRKKLLEDYWVKFNSVYEEISSMETTTDNDTDVKIFLDDDYYLKIETAYSEALGELHDIIDELSVQLHDPMTHSTPNRTIMSGGSTTKSILPQIQLPTFRGSFDEWLNFKDMFTTCVIEDTSLSDVQRLHFLNCSLRGDAANLLKNIRLSGNNFQVAWDILKGRYDNKRKLIKQYLHDILSLPSMTAESPYVLRQILDRTTEAIRALQQLGRPTDTWDDWLVVLVTDKLDPVTVKDWETSLESPDFIPMYSDLKKFLESRLQGLDGVSARPKPKQKDPSHKPSTMQQVRSHQTNIKRCPLCTGKHVLMFCSDFRTQTPQQRLTFVKKENLCTNCLRGDHVQFQCLSTYTCLRCHQKHHTMLHDGLSAQTSAPVNANHARTVNVKVLPRLDNSADEEEDDISSITLEPVLLATAEIKVQAATGHWLKLRALLDNGSQASFISEYAAQQLRLRRSRVIVPVTGVGGSSVGRSTGIVDISVCSLREPDFCINCKALVLPRLGNLKPPPRISTELFDEFWNLDLADRNFHEPGAFDVILGADMYGSLIRDEIIKSSAGTPVAQRTYLGWIIYGRLPNAITGKLSVNHCAFPVEIDELVQHMWKFNEHEDIEAPGKLTADEQFCEDFFKRTVRRTTSGRYIVKYPFKDSVDRHTLSDSKSDACVLLQHLLRRLNKDPKMRNMYQEFMAEYKRLGHMEIVHEENPTRSVCYLPHHGVYKESSLTTKLRTVFNAFRKYKSGKSLNDCLHVGPKLQKNLDAIILKWRTFRIAFMADIEKCYRQILVDEEDADMQRIMWISEDGISTAFRLLTVTYGVKSSSYLTIKVLNTLADDEGQSYPEAANVVKTAFYVDDCLYGSDMVSGAQKLQIELQELLLRGGFILRKWTSNSMDFLEGIDVSDQLDSCCCDLNLDSEIKALGIYWFCRTDCIGYQVNISKLSTPVTKRQQLSDVAKIYDPPCPLTPIVITGKIITQQLWLGGISWDEAIPEPHQQNRIKFRDQLPLIEEIKIPRWIFTSPDACSYQLHVFSDASTCAYAAVPYLRVKTCDGGCQISILMAKSKVAPLKKITVPCLELNGALLASKVTAKILDTLRLPEITTYCWTDSKTVLSWIRSNPGKHKQYVVNRLLKIQDLTSIDSWRYVPTTCNPADVASRGIYPCQLAELDICWHGPTWLMKEQDEWPKPIKIAYEESKVAVLFTAHESICNQRNGDLDELLHKKHQHFDCSYLLVFSIY